MRKLINLSKYAPPRITGSYSGLYGRKRPKLRTLIVLKLEEEGGAFHLWVKKLKAPIIPSTHAYAHTWIPIGEVLARTPTIYLIRELYARFKSNKHYQNLEVTLDLLDDDGQHQLAEFIRVIQITWDQRYTS